MDSSRPHTFPSSATISKNLGRNSSVLYVAHYVVSSRFALSSRYVYAGTARTPLILGFPLLARSPPYHRLDLPARHPILANRRQPPSPIWRETLVGTTTTTTLPSSMFLNSPQSVQCTIIGSVEALHQERHSDGVGKEDVTTYGHEGGGA